MLEEDQAAQKTLHGMMLDFIENGLADYYQTCGRMGKNYNKYCEFIVTRAPSRQDRRTILEKSPQFIGKYPVDEEFSFVFPEKEFQPMMLGQGFINCPKCCEDFKDKYPVCPRVP